MIARLSTCRTYLILVIVFSVVVCFTLYWYNPGEYRFVITTLSHSDKVILLWTPFFGYRDYMPTGQGALGQSGCPESRCEVTSDRASLENSDAVVFHCRDINVADLPAGRKTEQKWIFYCLESPHHSYFASFRLMKRMFNWTMSYRLDSDVVTSYGSYKRVGNGTADPNSNLYQVWMGKRRNVVWLVSNCQTPGNREGFVEELGRFIDVDVFGSCGKKRCPNDKLHHCLNTYVRDYMFFLAPENSICKDYVTEKFFRILNYQIIPIVFGGANYSWVAPPNSYINALSFENASTLAQHLRDVATNFTLYKSYFKWRENYGVPTPLPLICELCSKLYSDDDVGGSKTYDDISAWWVEESRCRRWGEEKQRLY